MWPKISAAHQNIFSGWTLCLIPKQTLKTCSLGGWTDPHKLSLNMHMIDHGVNWLLKRPSLYCLIHFNNNKVWILKLLVAAHCTRYYYFLIIGEMLTRSKTRRELKTSSATGPGFNWDNQHISALVPHYTGPVTWPQSSFLIGYRCSVAHSDWTPVRSSTPNTGKLVFWWCAQGSGTSQLMSAGCWWAEI